MNPEKYSLRELLDSYIRLISSHVDGIYRIDCHQAIETKLGFTLDESPEKITRLREILHNLDKEIDWNIEIYYDADDFKKMSKKLENKVRRI